jgi:hypothetical protein
VHPERNALVGTEETAVWRDLNLCSEAGVNIDAVEQPGLAQMKSRIADIDITVYELKPGSDWKPLARDLINRIDTTWPQKITFRDPDGRVISVEEALKKDGNSLLQDSQSL